MTRAIEQRLRTLEADTSTRPVRMVWSDTSDPAEWDRRISEMIASGEAGPDDEFVQIGWMRAFSPEQVCDGIGARLRSRETQAAVRRRSLLAGM
jgi:hypothetical protein